MKKRLHIFLLVLLCIVFQTAAVHADLIFEPEDSFYEKHADACEYVNRSYIVNGYDGETDVYESPESAEKVMTVKNREKYYISFVYTDRNHVKWGFIEDGQENSGWVPMDYMYPVYNSQSFYEEYKDKITPDEGIIPNVTKGDVIYGWTYPGSETKYKIEVMEDTFDYGSTFTDEEGHQWGNVGYDMGNRDFWVCVDEPQNPNLPVREINEEVKEAPEKIDGVPGTSAEADNGTDKNIRNEKADKQTAENENAAGTGTENIWTAALLVVLTAAVTGIIIKKFFGKKK